MQPETDLRRGLTASLIAETLVNYGHADEPLLNVPEPADEPDGAERGYANFQTDEQFWRGVSAQPEGAEVSFGTAVVTEWVARVPGLYWRQGAEARRRTRPEQVAEQIGEFVTLHPIGKSEVVSGGIGTLRFPPSEAGYRLCTLTMGRNASSGVPFLVAPEVWDDRHLGEGSLVSGSVSWRRLPIEWSSKFPTVAGLPRSCLVASKPEQLHTYGEPAAVEIHPFAVMEYETEDAPSLHDFVFATAQTGDPNMRSAIADFFEQYRQADGRQGSYLTAGDIAEPMWEATFASPEELRKAEPAALGLIEARLNDVMLGANTVEAAISQLAQFQPAELRKIAVGAELNAGKIDFGDAAATVALRVVDAAIARDRLPALLRIIQEEMA